MKRKVINLDSSDLSHLLYIIDEWSDYCIDGCNKGTISIEYYNKHVEVAKKIYDLCFYLNSKDGDYCDCNLRIALHK